MDEGESLVHGLVGVAIATIMVDRLEDWIGAESSSNLYWALTTLPQPFINMRKGLSAETWVLEFTFPLLKEIDKRTFSPEEAADLTEKIWTVTSRRRNTAETVLWATKAYPGAVRQLLSEGRSRAQIEQLPALQVVLLAGLHRYKVALDDLVKWNYAGPYGDASRAHEASDRFARQETQPFVEFLSPLAAVPFQPVLRMQRQLEALRALEALRLYAARHGNRWPARLSDITEVPVPLNPQTGKEFPYHLEGEAAVLEMPPPPGYRAADFGKRYVLTIRH
jgi:hypothetical protein